MINSRVPSSLMASRFATDIMRQQNAISTAQEQVSSGKQINRPSDAPAESAHLITMRETASRLEQYDDNSTVAESQLALEEGALNGSINILGRIRELALRANNGSMDAISLGAINSEITLALDELYTQSNSRDSFGNFIFSGSSIGQQPFVQAAPDTYFGSDSNINMEVSLGRTIQTGDSGADVFMRIRNGNGDFVTNADPANTGTGVITGGDVIDSSQFTAENYQISFTSATTYDVVNTDTGTAVATAQSYNEGASITADGMTMTISGDPVAGDIFTVAPSQNQDIFTSVSKLIDAIGITATTSTASQNAQAQSDLNTGINDLDNALDHLNTIRSRVGTRLSSIDSSRSENSDVALQIARVKSSIEDVDITEAVTRLQDHANTLEIIQATFARTQGATLFDFL